MGNLFGTVGIISNLSQAKYIIVIKKLSNDKIVHYFN